jgi:hypothetical protein
MKALTFTQARRQQQAEQAQAAAQAAARGAAAEADTAAALADGGREALTTVAGLIALPWTREVAKRKLRRDLKGAARAAARCWRMRGGA